MCVGVYLCERERKRVCVVNPYSPLSVTVNTTSARARGVQSGVGTAMGPLMLVWLVLIGAVGAARVLPRPDVWAGLSPMFAIK